MRTTINLDDDVFKSVKQYAAGRSVTLSRAVSELVRRGLRAPWPMRLVNGLYVFELPPDSPRVTSKKVKELEDQW